jgi:predicted Zn-dependent peptidase
MRRTLVALVLALALPAAAAAPAAAQDVASFEKKVSVKTLANGLTVLVCERPEAPVFSFFTLVDTGADREVPGITGLAHMFEHMAFKGTDRIGTSDYAAEKPALEAVEAAYAAYDAERRKRVGRDPAKVEELEKAWRAKIAEADRFVVPNEFGEIVERQGGVGLNAYTNSDETGYFYSFPSNRLELWAYLESERYLKPVMREFYKERDVVFEERRMSTESRPTARMIEQFLAAAFTAHPYGQPVVGWPSDLTSFSASDALAFHAKYYVPANMTIAVVGDVKAAELFPLIDTYFARLPATPKPLPLRTQEPAQHSERRVVMRDQAQPFYVEGYHRPAYDDPDDAVYDVLSDLLSSGRTSRLYRSLVRDKRIAAGAAGFSGLPGIKYPSLFAFYGIPVPGHTPQEIQDAIRVEIERLKSEDVSEAELRMVKTRVRANLIRQLDSNQGLAIQLATYQARRGDWRALFGDVERIQGVTAADVRRVANATFRDDNRTVAVIESTRMAGAREAGGAR